MGTKFGGIVLSLLVTELILSMQQKPCKGTTDIYRWSLCPVLLSAAVVVIAGGLCSGSDVSRCRQRAEKQHRSHRLPGSSGR